MARQTAWVLAGALLATPSGAIAECIHGAPTSSSIDQKQDLKSNDQKGGEPRRVKWWSEAPYRAELGISDQQSARIEQIFQEHLPEQRKRYRELEQLEPMLARLINEGTADPDVVAREVDRVENLTAEVRKSRIITLYRMHRELTGDQRMKLKALNERREADHRKSSNPGRRK